MSLTSTVTSSPREGASTAGERVARGWREGGERVARGWREGGERVASKTGNYVRGGEVAVVRAVLSVACRT